jgi:alpha-glucosidase
MTSRNSAPSAGHLLGHARFTVLTPRLVRLEWAADQVFEDRPTLAVLERHPAAAAGQATRTGDTLVLRTSALTLTYREDGKPFHRGNLSITFEMNGKPVTWHPGQHDRGNLGGTCRTLDCTEGDCRGDWIEKAPGQWGLGNQRTPIDLGHGFISRSGWAVVDDSRNIVLDGTEPWVTPRPAGERRDWYFFAHGHDYAGALREAAGVFGRQPLPPRFALGYWWSRYWAYTDREIETLVDQFDRYQLPLDVMVVDMDWHLPGWTGYTWDRRYFPDPDAFLAELRRRGLKITLNLHPAEGVARQEEAFPAMCQAMGLKAKTAERVPFDITDPKYMDAYFKVLHHPEEKRGVDFWWMDWQQGESTRMPGLDTLPWINHLHWMDMVRNPARGNRRPLIFSRYGGPGAGRYCIGFSGDTVAVWESLRYQPYFTATAANVLYGYWSHDIGGHMPGTISPELYLRWMQFGAHSPVLRTHTTKNPDAERRVFAYPQPYADLMMDCIRLRKEMIPYIYTEMRKGVDSGLSLCRPLYYECPEDNAAYQARNQYRFGDAMIVAPVLAPADADGLSEVRVWLPPGQWFDTALGESVAGGRWLRRHYLPHEIPVFVRPGAVIPGQRPTLRSPPGSYRDLVVTCWPGADGRYDLYEDDGESTGYQGGEAAWIPLAQQTAGTRRTITVGPAKGRFAGFVAERTLELRLPASVPPAAVQVGRRTLPWSERPADGCWAYDGDTATTIIRLDSVEVTRGIRVQVTEAANQKAQTADGLKGRLARLAEAARLVTSFGGGAPVHDEERLATGLAQTGNRLTRWPETFAAELRALDAGLVKLPGVLRQLAAPLVPGETAKSPAVATRRTRCRQALRLLKG